MNSEWVRVGLTSHIGSTLYMERIMSVKTWKQIAFTPILLPLFLTHVERFFPKINAPFPGDTHRKWIWPLQQSFFRAPDALKGSNWAAISIDRPTNRWVDCGCVCVRPKDLPPHHWSIPHLSFSPSSSTPSFCLFRQHRHGMKYDEDEEKMTAAWFPLGRLGLTNQARRISAISDVEDNCCGLCELGFQYSFFFFHWLPRRERCESFPQNQNKTTHNEVR